MVRYKLYYWLSHYNSILPASIPQEDWTEVITPVIDDFLKLNYGNREMIFDSIEYLDNADDTTILAWIKNKLALLFNAKNESYKRIFEVFQEDYNPLWNVDGVEIETHTGKDTHKNSGSDTITNAGNDIHAYTGSDTNTSVHTGTDTNTAQNTGTDTNTEHDTGTDTTTHSVATFDNPTPVLASQDATQYGKTVTNTTQHGLTTTNTLQHGETVTDTTQHGLTDTLTHGHTITTQNGKQLEDSYGHVITHERHGNIGVTKSTELVADQVRTWEKMNFVDMVARDIVNTICYSVI